MEHIEVGADCRHSGALLLLLSARGCVFYKLISAILAIRENLKLFRAVWRIYG
jgi:hypothetical protein